MARSAFLSAAAAALATVAASETIALTMSLAQAGVGSAGPITGTVTGVDGLTYSNYKVAVLTSGDGGNTWWDKTHGPYRNHQLANPGYDAGDAQNAGVVIQSDWSWTLQGYQASPNDAVSDLWVGYLLPASFDLRYPDYQVEGIQMPGNLVAAAICYVEMSKTRGLVAGGPGGCACGGGGVPNTGLANNPNGNAAASPAAPSPSSAASPSSVPASPTPAAASPSAAPASASPAAVAASPSAAAAPASPSAAAVAASPAANTNGGGNNALPASSTAASPAPATSSVPATSTSTVATPAALTSGTAPAAVGTVLTAAAAAVAGALLLVQ